MHIYILYSPMTVLHIFLLKQNRNAVKNLKRRVSQTVIAAQDDEILFMGILNIYSPSTFLVHLFF